MKNMGEYESQESAKKLKTKQKNTVSNFDGIYFNFFNFNFKMFIWYNHMVTRTYQYTSYM